MTHTHSLIKPLIIFVVALIMPLLIYVLLPLADIEQPARIFNFMPMLFFCILAACFTSIYIILDRFLTIENYTIFVCIYLFNFSNLTYLADLSPVKIPFRVITLGLIFLPSVFLFLKYWRDITSFYKTAWLIFTFISISAYYYFFFSSGVYGSQTGAGLGEAGIFSQYGESKIDIFYLFLLFFASIIFSWRLFACRQYHKFFYIINIGALTAITLTYLISITIPHGSFYAVVEDVQRFKSLYFHPNQLGHASSLFLIYMLTLFAYYREDLSKKNFIKFLIFAIAIQAIVLILSLSKTAFLAFGVAFVMLAKTAYRKNFYKLSLLTVLCGTIGFIIVNLYALYSLQNSIYALLEERFTNMESLYWRFKVWNILFSNNDFYSALFGHGMASAREYVNFFLQSKGESILIHNGYITFWYDYGIFSLPYILYLFSLCFYRMTRDIPFQLKVLNAGVNALALYILVSGALDEVFEGIYFFLLSALLLGFLQAQAYDLNKHTHLKTTHPRF